MTSKHTTIQLSTRGKGLYPFTSMVSDWLSNQPILHGTLTVFVQHTSCSLLIQENADPDVPRDMRDFFERLVPEEERHYRHTLEGLDDMTSHIRAALTQTSITIPVINGHMALGTWQGLFLFEHRRAPHRRSVVLHVIGL